MTGDQYELPEPEAVRVTMSWTSAPYPSDEDGFIIQIEEAEGHKMIGRLSLSRTAMAECLASRANQSASWRQYRSKGDVDGEG